MRLRRFVLAGMLAANLALGSGVWASHFFQKVPLAITSLQSSALYPGLPTVAAAVPDYMSILGMWAPAKTPEAIIKRLTQESARFYNAPETKQRLLGMGFERVGSSPEEFAAVIRTDLTAIEKLARDGVFI